MAGLDAVLETTTAERPATGFVFTEGPLWHPDGFYYFADVRASMFYRLRLGQMPETVRSNTGEGNGTTARISGLSISALTGRRPTLAAPPVLRAFCKFEPNRGSSCDISMPGSPSRATDIVPASASPSFAATVLHL